MKKRNYYFLLMFVMMNIMAMATSTIRAEVWDGAWRTIRFDSGQDKVKLNFTAPESKTYTFVCNTADFGIRIKAVCGVKSAWSDPLHDFYGATVSIDATAGSLISLIVETDGEESFPIIVPMELVDDADGKAWDGSKKDVEITGYDASVTLTFTPTESKVYTFKCDTKDYAPRIKAIWEGQTTPAWSNLLYEFTGAILEVDAVAGRTITLEVTAAEEESYPVSFPLEAIVRDDTPAESWDGKTLAIKFEDKDASKKLAYTAIQDEMLYIFSTASAYDVKFAGGVVGQPDAILPWEAYDNQVGGYSSIRLMEGDVLQFTVTSNEYLEGQGAGFPRSFTINSMAVPFSGMFLPGYSMETPVNLVENVETIIPVNENYTEFPIFDSYGELSWLKFTSAKNGIANINIETDLIYVYEGEENIGALDYTPMSIVQGANDISHRFVVKAGVEYYIVVPNSRPAKATLVYEDVEEGGDCIMPVNIDSQKGTLSVKKGTTWFRYAVGKNGDILELSSKNNWSGTVTYYKDCTDIEPIVTEVTKTAKSYLEIDLEKGFYFIGIESDNNVTDAIDFVQRESKSGETKLNPLDAKLGENTFGGEKRDYWFKYVASKDCMLNITYPENAPLTLIVFETGTTNAANPDATSCILRANEGEEYRLKFENPDTENANFTISETKIAEGDYCDYPRYFNLGENIQMVNRNAQEEWYAFTASEDGIIEFEVEDEIWVRDHWSCAIVKECGGIHDLLAFDEFRGMLTYRYSVLKGQTYRFTVYQFYTAENGTKPGDDIIIKTKFTPAGEGESCDKAIGVNYNEVTTCKDVASETWYEFVLPEDGIYYIVASLGQGGNLKYKLGDCGAVLEKSIATDYMYGRAYVKLAKTENGEDTDLKAGQVVKIYASIGKDKPEDQKYDYSLVVRKAVAGDDLSTPFATQKGVYYTLNPGDVTTAATIAGCPYAITASADAKIELTVLTDEAYFSGNFEVYSGTSRVGCTMSKTKTDNGDGTYTYAYTFSGDNIQANKTYTVLVPFTVFGFNLGSSLIVGVESTEYSDAIIVYPNPTDGNFQVVLGELAAKGALVEVVNMAGAIIYKENTTSAVTSVNLEGIASGVYFVRVHADGKSAVAKLIVR